MFRTFFALFFCLLVGAYPSTSSAQTDSARIVFTCSLPTDIPGIKTLESYYRDAFAKLGYQFTMIQRPEKRSLAEARSGQSDGECARIPDTFSQEQLSDFAPVDVVIGTTTINLWGRYPGKLEPIQLNSESKVCIVESSSAAQQWLEAFRQNHPDNAPEVYEINSYQTALRMLAFGRLDYCVGAQVSFENAARRNSLRQQVFDNGTLFRAEAKPLLNRKHIAIAPAFARELQAIVDERGQLSTQ